VGNELAVGASWISVVLTAVFGTGGVAWATMFLTERQRQRDAARQTEDSEFTRSKELWDRMKADNDTVRDLLRAAEAEIAKSDKQAIAWAEIAREEHDRMRDFRHECNDRLMAAYAAGKLGADPPQPMPPLPPLRKPD